MKWYIHLRRSLLKLNDSRDQILVLGKSLDHRSLWISFPPLVPQSPRNSSLFAVKTPSLASAPRSRLRSSPSLLKSKYCETTMPNQAQKPQSHLVSREHQTSIAPVSDESQSSASAPNFIDFTWALFHSYHFLLEVFLAIGIAVRERP